MKKTNCVIMTMAEFNYLLACATDNSVQVAASSCEWFFTQGEVEYSEPEIQVAVGRQLGFDVEEILYDNQSDRFVIVEKKVE